MMVRSCRVRITRKKDFATGRILVTTPSSFGARVAELTSYGTETWWTKANIDVNVYIYEIYLMAYVMCLLCCSLSLKDRKRLSVFKHKTSRCSIILT